MFFARMISVGAEQVFVNRWSMRFLHGIMYYSPVYEAIEYIESEDELDNDSYVGFIRCNQCGIEVHFSEANKPRDLLERWNERKPIQEILQEFNARIFFVG